MNEPGTAPDGSAIRAICIMGPTGAGKTALAEALYGKGGFELISVDSAQVYRQMNVGTAKPSAKELAQTPHHLIDIRQPWETYSAAEFARDAGALMRAINLRGHTPVLVGGTMLYFRALLEGLSALPQASAQIRAALEQEAAAVGWLQMHAQLARVDPAAAQRIHPNDPQRIQRALEVYRASGQPISKLQTRRTGAFAGQFLKLAVSPADRGALHRRINARFDQMLEAGLLNEVRHLMTLPQLGAETPSMRAVGYRQAWQHLSGEFGVEELRARATAATRQLAKRQLTWLRHVDGVGWLDPAENCWKSSAIDQIARFLHKAL